MTAPARSRRTTNRTTTAEPARREVIRDNGDRQGLDAPAVPTRAGSAGRKRSAAAVRAYERRAQRTGTPVPADVDQPRRARRQRERPEQRIASRASFVMLVIGLLAGGVVATLWLSTQAIQDSYRLDRAKRVATELAERAQMLQREVAYLESASRLAEEAAKAGMVESGDPAHVVVREDGSVAVIGQPTAAKPTAPPADRPQAGQQSAGQQQAGQPAVQGTG